ncbi:MAG TPA: amino acid adenylation domain-containing protein, partial [Ktedonobacteraceae bacterium]|nr:amino acid adenylation domain-containing protein [Ktedonobacteraceae bacterium]
MSDPSKKLANLSPEAKRALLAQLLRDRASQARPSGEKAGERLTPKGGTAGPDEPAHRPVNPQRGHGGHAPAGWSAISHNQKALWFLSRLAPESAAYNLLYAARIQSELDSPALQRAIQALAQRYPILTGTYTMQDGEPVQHFHPDRAIPLEEVDATDTSLDDLKHQLYIESNRPIDLEKGHVLRVRLYKRSGTDYILALIAHHIAVDFWALDILVDELYVLYVAEKAGIPSPLPAPGPQNAEYVRWQNEMLAGLEGERHWNYWQHELAGELPLISLPIDKPRPPRQTYQGASHSFALSDDLSSKLRALANAEKVTLFTLMLAAYQTLLFRYTNQEDIVIGTPALGRNRVDLEKVIGYLANPVMLRANFAGNPTFKELLDQTKRSVLEGLEHQDFPFPLLVERLQPKRDPSHSPIYQTLFIWDRPRTRGAQDLAQLGRGELVQRIAEEGLKLEPFAYGQQGAPFDLTLTIFEIDGSLSADFRYNVDLFEPATIARIEKHLQVLLSGIVANPEQRLLELPLLTEEEQQQILVEWNATQSDYPDDVCLHQLIEQQVERTPDEPAVIFEGQRRTYRELNREANQLAHLLQAAGIGPEVMVGVCMERSVEMVVALLAILKAGGAYVPMDPSYPQERLAYMIEDAQVPVLLTQTRFENRLPRENVKIITLDPEWSASLSGPDDNPNTGVGPDNLIYMIYTSGSTGKPKGVMNIHRSLCNRLHWMQQAYQLTTADRVLQKTPFSFDVAGWEFFWPLLTGACLVVARSGGHQDPAYLASLIAEQKITTLHFVPSMLQAFLQEPDLKERCQSLRHIVCSGEALSFELQERFFASFDGLNVQLHNLYGPTEAAIDVTYWECQRGQGVTIGRPIANTQIYILNAAMQPVPINVPGELFIGGVNVARGYHHRPELTAEKFIRDPFGTTEGARLFRTADLARYRADGAIEFLGRSDHQVKIRGFRIELGEIEAVLSQHPAIQDVVVVAREDTPGNKRLVAYLVFSEQEDRHPSIEDLRNFLKDKLPSYMIPAAFVFLDALPLQPNGKVDRKALPAPDTTRPELEATYVAPRTPTEERLAAIWAEVLGIDRVGIQDNYFDLGGASIQSLDIIAKANEAGIPLALEMLFEHQTIAELAEHLNRDSSGTGLINRAPADGNAPATDGAPAAQQQGQTESSVLIEQTAQDQQVPVVSSAPEVVVQTIEPDTSNTIIESLGTYLPPKIVSSKEIIANCARPIRFPLAQLTGIKNRRMAGETEFSIDLAKKAIEECLANSKYNPQDIDLLICGNISRCHTPGFQITFEPSTSIQLQQHFGFTNAQVFDVSNACTGLFTAAYIADAFMKAGLARRALVVSGEYITHLVRTAQLEIENFMDSRLACLTVGDAGAALILDRSPDKKYGFHAFDMYSLGHYSWDCIGKATDQEHGGGIMYTDAVKVSAVNMTQAVSHAAYTIDRARWPRDSFQHIIVHQTSKTTINDVAREINKYFGEEVCKPESVINNIAERANTATTTHMVAVMDYIRSGRINTGDNTIFGITGSGATIGTAIYTFDNLPERIRRREAGEYAPEKVTPESRRFVPLLPATKRVRIESVGTVPE